jgi:hypothetical protein
MADLAAAEAKAAADLAKKEEEARKGAAESLKRMNAEAARVKAQ